MPKLSPPPIDVRSLLKSGFSEEIARQLYAQGVEVVVFVMLQLAALAVKAIEVSGVDPSAPSGSVPAYQKEPKKKRKRKPGAKVGHKGSRRPPPKNITNHVEHRAKCCPICGGKLRKRSLTRKRYIEDIPADIVPEVTEHIIYRYYCPKCKKIVEPVVPDAMPNATIGHWAVVLSAFFHYFIGITILKIVSIFRTIFHFKVTPGGLVHLWQKLASVLYPWYEQIAECARNSAVLQGDETSWRINGVTYWLWCFSNQDLTYFVIDKSRASPVVKRFLGKVFKGILVTDFWGAYNAIVCAGKQRCLVHLLGNMKKVHKDGDKSKDWPEFSKLLKRILRDAMRLRGRKDHLEPKKYERLCVRIEDRLTKLLLRPWKNCEAKRLVKRLRRHRQELFVFLYHEGVPYDNNHSERTIRNGVVMRKNSYCNRSLDGAKTQAVMMSIFTTLKQRGQNVIQTIVKALSELLTTKKLPPLPQNHDHSAE